MPELLPQAGGAYTRNPSTGELFPSVGPALGGWPFLSYGGANSYVDLIINSQFHSLMQFSRLSGGLTEIAEGVFTQASVNEPRYQWLGGKRGLLIESAATNQLFPSAVAATMSVTVAATAQVLSFFGTGTVTLSGAATGSVVGTGVALKEYAFTPTAGLLTLTVSGAVTMWQLENGSKASSRITTVTAPATRSPDLVSIPTSAFGFNPSEGTFVCDYQDNVFGRGVIEGIGAVRRYMASAGGGQIQGFNGSALVQTSNSSVLGARHKAAFSYGADGGSVCLSGGSVASQAGDFSGSSLTGLFLFGGALSINGVAFSLSYYPRKFTAAELQAVSG